MQQNIHCVPPCSYYVLFRRIGLVKNKKEQKVNLVCFYLDSGLFTGEFRRPFLQEGYHPFHEIRRPAGRLLGLGLGLKLLRQAVDLGLVQKAALFRSPSCQYFAHNLYYGKFYQAIWLQTSENHHHRPRRPLKSGFAAGNGAYW